MKTQWNLSLFYASEKDPQIQKDLAKISQVVLDFEKTYRNESAHLEDAEKLKKALDGYEKVVAALDAPRPLFYFYYRTHLDAADAVAQAEFNRLADHFSKEQNRILFFELSLGKLSEKQQEKFLQEKALKKYHYFLKKAFEAAAHDLTEPEEKIMNLKSLPARQMWLQGMNKAVAAQTVAWEGQEVPLAATLEKIADLPTKERRELHDLTVEAMRDISGFAESELNALVTNKKIDDELRGFGQPYSATLLAYENSEESVLNLAETVRENYPLCHRFFDLKARMMGLAKLEYADRGANPGQDRKECSWEEGLKVVRDRFAQLGPRYVEILDAFLENGQIDVWPKKGKQSGAFCSPGIDSPTMVLLNHTKGGRSIVTLAHEMGHAIHSELAKSQPPLYQGYSISLAETASTFFEQLVFEGLLNGLPDEERMVALADKIGNRDCGTIFRQIACFSFEEDLHRLVREKGFLPKEEMAALMNQRMQGYLGPTFEMKEADGYFFVNWTHLRNFFYVYTYAFGQLASRAMFERYRQDPAYMQQVEKFLSAGGHKSPEDILKDIGIDTSQKSFWQEGLAGLKKDIDELEKLFSKKK